MEQKKIKNKIGIIDVGGGNRCVYSAGIYDCLLDNDFMPDYAIGVSAGSANLITYIAKQRGRTYRFYTEYAGRKEYLSLGNIFKYGSPVGLDYIFGTLSNEGGEDPVDYDAFVNNPVEFYVAATRQRDGKGIFFDRRDFKRNDLTPLKASCSLPVICRARKVGYERYVDGGVAEPIPLQKALDDGCDKIIIVLTKPRIMYEIPDKMIFNGGKRMPWMPLVGERCRDLHLRSADILLKVAELEKQGKVYVVEPEDTYGVSTLSKDLNSMKKLYTAGYEDGLKLFRSEFLK